MIFKRSSKFLRLSSYSDICFMKETAIYCVLLLISGINSAVSAETYDSLRVEIRNGQKVIIHKIEAKETFFALSRRYQVTADLIKGSNPGLVDGLKIGEQIVIPMITVGSPEIQPTHRTHFVDIGETLFSISRKYGVEVGDLQLWNNLESVDLDVGQELIVTTPGKIESNSTTVEFDNKNDASHYHVVVEKETLFAVSQKYGIGVKELRQINSLPGNEISIGQRLIVKQGIAETNPSIEVVKNTLVPDATASEVNIDSTIVEEPKKIIPINAKDVNQFNTRVIKDGELEKVVEEGLAKVIDNTTNTKKYLALHRTAEIGTVMQVINMANNMNIYVRVVGKLPDTGENSRVLIKISRTAYEKFRAVDNQFPVQIIYIP